MRTRFWRRDSSIELLALGRPERHIDVQGCRSKRVCHTKPRNDGAGLARRIPSTAADKTSGSERLKAWTRGYFPLPGTPDEFMDVDGHARPYWLHMLAALAGYEPNEVQQSFATADRRIRNRGLSYRVAGEENERVWPISRMPLLITEQEWRVIAAGVVQRAELLNNVLADIYGKGALVAEGALPAAALTGSSDYVAAMRGVTPPGGRWLRLYAVDLGRGPDGSWWALGDRTQAPSGCGYALENRLVISQAFPDLYAQLNVERLAPFFQALSAGLKSAARRAEPRIGILTPGPLSLTYFEQAYLARYLGFLLVEGDDLVMRDGRVFVRTIAGLKQCDVIWRHVDADWCDPLELNASSRIGVPGLLDGDSARRRGRGEHAGRRARRVSGASGFPARTGRSIAQARAAHSKYCDVVVRATEGARTGTRRIRYDLDRGGLRRPAAWNDRPVERRGRRALGQRAEAPA